MNDLQHLANRLPVNRISRREMFTAKMKMRVQDFMDLNYPVAYRYGKKFLKYVGIINS